jgi:fructose/tagatose bisphosphate aldolase
MSEDLLKEFTELLGNSVEITPTKVRVTNPSVFKSKVHLLAEASALEKGAKQATARYIVRAAAADLGIYPASINDLYMGRSKGIVPLNFTVPEMNLRVLAFDCARAVFRTAVKMDSAAMIFEIARSEMGYTDQKPAEYTTSVLAAAIAEGYKGPVFIQGDHFQASAKKYAADSKAEVDGLKALIREALAAGFYNIDIDTSTLVDINKPTIPEQQALNVKLSAEFTAYIRSQQPKGVTVSVGGEIGEVGGHNSTEAELRGYLDGYNAELAKLAKGATGLSKISIQTGTSHGGVVLPDGSIAKVNVDFNILKELSRVARSDYGLGGTVQHGASTLPEDAFGKFVEYEACEVHLATNFANMFFDLIPESLRDEMYAYLREHNSADRKPDMTEEQFYYKVRKNAIGAFKAKSWKLSQTDRDKIDKAWEAKFDMLFHAMKIGGTHAIVEKVVKTPVVVPPLSDYLGESGTVGDVKDLAD